MEEILVIGATGNIGLPVVKSLVANPQIHVKAGVHNVAHAQQVFQNEPNIELVEFDFLKPATFANALANVSKVFFVRPPQLANPKQDMLPFLKFVKQAQIKQLVFVSLLGVEHNPMTPHHKIEKMIRELEIPHTFIRPSFFMQNLNTTHQFDIQERHDLFIPAGNAKTSFIDTRDIGEVAAVCLTNTQYLNQELDLTGPDALTYDEIAAVLTKNLGEDFSYSKPSLWKFRQTMIKRGIRKDYVNVMVMLYLITQLGNAKKVTPTVAEVLGRPARTMTDYVNDYRQDFLRKG